MPWWIILLAGAVIGAGAVAMIFGRALDLAKTRIGGASQVVPSPYGAIEFAATGDGPAVLAVHGAGGGFDQGLMLGAPLAARGFHVVAPSRFGYLRSSLPKEASPEAQADAFAFLLRGLGIERVFVIGASAGAPSAMQFALRHRDLCTALALLVPIAFSPDARARAARIGFAGNVAQFLLLRSSFLFWLAMKLAPGVMTRAILATDPAVLRRAPPEEQRRAQSMLRNILPVAPRGRGMRRDARLAARVPPYPLAEIAVPTLAISCEDDLFGTHAAARHTASGVQRGRFIGYPSGGHLFLGHGEAVWAEVEAFFRAELARTEAIASAEEKTPAAANHRPP